MKISSIHLPKSERGRTVVMGLSQRLQPQDVASMSTASRRKAVRIREGLRRRLIMVTVWGVLTVRGRPAGPHRVLPS